MSNKKWIILFMFLFFPISYATPPIVFGQSAFLGDGALQLYGELIRNAIHARFNRINKLGGINGQKLELVSMDDRGEPEITQKNISIMRKRGIDMFLGNMGTRSVFKVLPLIEKKEIAILFPWGGDKRLRKPHLTNLVNGLGLMAPQLDKIIEYIFEDLRLKKIAIFYDDSAFGKTNKNEIITQLKSKGVTPVATASYNRFTMDIETPAKKLIKTDPKVVICLATSMPTVKLINSFLERGHYGTKFIGIDSTMFVGDILKRKGIDFAYSSPMPHPKKSNLPIVKQFREDLSKYFPADTPNVLSLSYYIHAAIICEALKKIQGPITKEKLLVNVENMKNYNLGGFIVSMDPNTRHAYPHKISILRVGVNHD
jgi:ABC-type branched-subunit amino acid transport system substrate-binding protein